MKLFLVLSLVFSMQAGAKSLQAEPIIRKEIKSSAMTVDQCEKKGGKVYQAGLYVTSFGNHKYFPRHCVLNNNYYDET